MSTRKSIGFLSFGHWTPHHSSATQSAADAKTSRIELGTVVINIR